ncbi:MAG: S41 family peptidase [Opitutae bacterium]|nr:S41 family peptidase [Opitutae bacterium]
MLKRLLTLAVGVALGLLLAGAAAHFAASWSLLPNRELNRSTAYLREVLKLVNENYVAPDKAAYDKLTREALHGMVEALDPHSEFLEARDFKELDDEMRGDFGGIGIQVERRNGHVIVIAPVAGGPGERAGIQRGDEILAVDGKSVDRAASMDDVIDLLRGKPDTKVTVKLQRAGTPAPWELTLKRELIKVDSVREVSVLPGGIGYIQLSEFTERTSDEFAHALDRLLAQGVNSLVLDLRNNPGGLLDAAVEVSEMFFRKGELIVYTQGRRAKDREDFLAETEGDPVNLPMAVLINAGSASAAEIVAGALKDTGRAVLVGERSFGKGSVQSIFRLHNGEGMRLTTARYFTPSGVTIHEKGVEPHIEVVMTPDEDNKLRLQRTRGDLAAPQAFAQRFGFEPIEDRQLQAALDALRGVTVLAERGVLPLPQPAKPPAKPSTKKP